MINVPQPPDTFTTLQIPCVACHEVFTIAEAYQTPDGDWRLPADHHPAVQMRYEDNLTRQPVRSYTRADPEINPNSFGSNQPDTYVNCPRCGADNRNWLRFIGPAPLPVGCALRFLLPREAITWQQKFPGAFLSIIVAIILAPLTLLMAMAVQDSLTWGLVLAGAVILAALFTAVDLTRDWNDLRLDTHIRTIMPHRKRSREASLWQRGFIIIVLLGFLMPIVFFQMAPRALGFISAILRDTPQTAVVTGNQRLSQIDQNYNQESIIAIEEAIKNIDNLKEIELGPTEVEEEITQILTGLQEQLEGQNLLFTQIIQKDINEQIQSLEAYVAESERLIDERRKKADANALNDITADLRIIGLWWLMVSLSTLVSVLMTMHTLKSFVERIDGLLPRPIFSSISDMTRVTIWEAKRSLQIEGDMCHIQWIEAARNERGGINLIGLHRDKPDLDAQNNPISQTVRAQRYIISTNLFGRILNTLVQDVRVAQTISHYHCHPAETHSDDESNPPQDYITLSPDSPEDDLAQGFFPLPVSPLPPDQPAQEGVIVTQPAHTTQVQTIRRESLRQRSTSVQSNQPTSEPSQVVIDLEATPPANQIPQNQPVTPPQSRIYEQQSVSITSATMRERNVTINSDLVQEHRLSDREQASVQKLRHELAREMDRVFNLSDLQHLCFLLNIAYENIVGAARINKCDELIKYCERRNRLVELVQECISLRPHAFESDVFVSLVTIPYIDAPTEQEASDAKEERLCKNFVVILNDRFTNDQLQQLSEAINLTYNPILETRLEFCQDIMRFYRRRQLLSQLADKAINMRPNEPWNEILDLTDS